VKGVETQQMRTLFANRRLLKRNLIDLENHIRGALRAYGLTVTAFEHFEEFKESETIEVCSTATMFSKNIVRILKEKLTRRNMVAHPSQVVITQPQADDALTDLVNNVVLALT
jgi:hypothetical protein